MSMFGLVVSALLPGLTLAQTEAPWNSSLASLLCPDGTIVSPEQDWVWDAHGVAAGPSCSKPYPQNTGKMCSNDLTSVVLSSHGKPSCSVTAMPHCRFDMHDLEQIDFDVTMLQCGDTWAAPLWITPNHWEGGGRSGEIDMVEMCPHGAVHSNFAGAGKWNEKPAYPKKWAADPNNFDGHVTLWKTVADGHRPSITVKLCEKHEAAAHGGHCNGDGAAFYPDILSSHACGDDHDCHFMFVSDIWNALKGDGGAKACMAPGGASAAHCSTSVRNIRVQGPQFKGKCAVLGGYPQPTETTTSSKEVTTAAEVTTTSLSLRTTSSTSTNTNEELTTTESSTTNAEETTSVSGTTSTRTPSSTSSTTTSAPVTPLQWCSAASFACCNPILNRVCSLSGNACPRCSGDNCQCADTPRRRFSRLCIAGSRVCRNPFLKHVCALTDHSCPADQRSTLMPEVFVL